jgi:hypothetical protein
MLLPVFDNIIIELPHGLLGNTLEDERENKMENDRPDSNTQDDECCCHRCLLEQSSI